MYHYTKAQDDKEHFVIYYLSDLLRWANADIMRVNYHASENGETVVVTMKNGAVYDIDVTADSIMALAKDVISFMSEK